MDSGEVKEGEGSKKRQKKEEDKEAKNKKNPSKRELKENKKASKRELKALEKEKDKEKQKEKEQSKKEKDKKDNKRKKDNKEPEVAAGSLDEGNGDGADPRKIKTQRKPEENFRISVMLKKGRPICEQGEACTSEDPFHFVTFEHTEREKKELEKDDDDDDEKEERRKKRKEAKVSDPVKPSGRKIKVKIRRKKTGEEELIVTKKGTKSSKEKDKDKKKKGGTLTSLQGKLRKKEEKEKEKEKEKQATKKSKSEGEETTSSSDEEVATEADKQKGKKEKDKGSQNEKGKGSKKSKLVNGSKTDSTSSPSGAPSASAPLDLPKKKTSMPFLSEGATALDVKRKASTESPRFMDENVDLEIDKVSESPRSPEVVEVALKRLHIPKYPPRTVEGFLEKLKMTEYINEIRDKHKVNNYATLLTLPEKDWYDMDIPTTDVKRIIKSVAKLKKEGQTSASITPVTSSDALVTSPTLEIIVSGEMERPLSPRQKAAAAAAAAAPPRSPRVVEAVANSSQNNLSVYPTKEEQESGEVVSRGYVSDDVVHNRRVDLRKIISEESLGRERERERLGGGAGDSDSVWSESFSEGWSETESEVENSVLRKWETMQKALQSALAAAEEAKERAQFFESKLEEEKRRNEELLKILQELRKEQDKKRTRRQVRKHHHRGERKPKRPAEGGGSKKRKKSTGGAEDSSTTTKKSQSEVSLSTKDKRGKMKKSHSDVGMKEKRKKAEQAASSKVKSPRKTSYTPEPPKDKDLVDNLSAKREEVAQALREERKELRKKKKEKEKEKEKGEKSPKKKAASEPEPEEKKKEKNKVKKEEGHEKEDKNKEESKHEKKSGGSKKKKPKRSSLELPKQKPSEEEGNENEGGKGKDKAEDEGAKSKSPKKMSNSSGRIPARKKEAEKATTTEGESPREKMTSIFKKFTTPKNSPRGSGESGKGSKPGTPRKEEEGGEKGKVDSPRKGGTDLPKKLQPSYSHDALRKKNKEEKEGEKEAGEKEKEKEEEGAQSDKVMEDATDEGETEKIEKGKAKATKEGTEGKEKPRSNKEKWYLGKVGRRDSEYFVKQAEVLSLKQKQTDVRKWIEAVTGEHFDSDDFIGSLKSGVLLCKLVNSIRPGMVKTINTQKFPLFLQIENIINFIKACLALGVRNQDLFEPVDLYEDKNAARVVSCLDALGRVVAKLPDYSGPVLQLSPAKIGVGSTLEVKSKQEGETETEKRGSIFGDLLRKKRESNYNNNNTTSTTSNNNSTNNMGESEKESWAKKMVRSSQSVIMEVLGEGRKRSTSVAAPEGQAPSGREKTRHGHSGSPVKKASLGKKAAAATEEREEETKKKKKKRASWHGTLEHEGDADNLKEDDGWIFPDAIEEEAVVTPAQD